MGLLVDNRSLVLGGSDLTRASEAPLCSICTIELIQLYAFVIDTEFETSHYIIVLICIHMIE